MECALGVHREGYEVPQYNFKIDQIQRDERHLVTLDRRAS
jgi:hypothetical protein